ncbi:MAG TPA: type IV secretory system conjugative DNA transfer family protein [Conexibacter sp.]|nr:type IV secretory system conjugative DNA transfer family protein [Conexibacter sp.]
MSSPGGARAGADRGQQVDPVMAAALAGIALFLVLLAWSTPTLAAWVHSGSFARVGLLDALAATVDGRLFGPDPALAYPRSVRALLPGARGFWGTAALVAITLAAALLALARAIDVRMSRPSADQRWWQLRGRRPHEFGRYRTVPELLVDRPSPDRVVVGRIGRPGSLLAITSSVQMAVVAAPRTGKSSGLVIPAILEHEGPVVTTSVRTDIAEHTLARRRRLGRVWVWDPFGRDSDSWDLLQGCEDWEHALLVARWLGHARKIGEGINQDYFDQEAEGLVAPYLHAAALTPDVNAEGVYRWILNRDLDTPIGILEDVGADDAADRLKAVYAYTERQRDGIIGTAAVQFKAYGHPAAGRTARRGEGFTPEALFDGANTLYIVAGREHQQLLAPLVVTMISSMLFALSEQENRSGRGLTPMALFAIDETASIAPIQDLPQILATSLGTGVRFLTVWHSVAQIRRHFGVDAAAEILALSQAKVFMGSITDQYTRQEIVELLGRRQSAGAATDVMSAQALQRTSAGEGLLINGDLPPVVFRQRRHYLDPELRRLKGSLPAAAGGLPGRSTEASR